MRSRDKLLSLILLGSVLGSTISPIPVYAVSNTTNINAVSDDQGNYQLTDEEKQEIQDALEKAKQEASQYKFSDQTLVKLSELEKLVILAEKSPSDKTVDDAYNFFANIRTVSDDYYAHKDGDQFDKLFLRIIAVMKDLPVSERNTDFIDFQIKLRQAYDAGNNFYQEYVWYLHTDINIPEIANKLKETLLEMLGANDKPDVEVPVNDGVTEKDDGKIADPVDVGNPVVINPPVATIENNYISYEKQGNGCYRLTTYLDEKGNTKRVDKEVALKAEYVFCNIFDYVDFGGGSSGVSGGGNQWAVPVWGYMDTNINPESNMTIQYTINKDGENPYFFDTGIRASLNNTITFEQLRDVLYQVAIKSGGYFVEDKDKVLAVIEGKPIVVKYSTGVYNKTDVENIFKNFSKIDVRIMETRIGRASSLEEKVITKQAKKVKIDGKDVELIANPLVKNDRALLPIEQIAKELGATTSVNNGKYIIVKNNSTVVYEMKKSYVLVNGQAVEMVASPEFKDGYFMAEVQELATALGYDIMWDGETSTIILNVKK